MNGVLGGQEVYLKYVVSNNLLQWVNQFRPEIIYCHASSLMKQRFVHELRNVLEIPLCIHIMDDWLNVKYREGIFAPRLRPGHHREFEFLLAEASLRMGINRKMCDAYEERYGYSFEPFSNAVGPAFLVEA